VPTGEPPPVCISPGQTTVISFDADLAPGSLTLESAERFSKVEPGPSAVKLVPSERVALGEPLRLTVRFRDGAAPASATLLLVAHASQAAPLVEVHREARTVESYQQELRAKEEEARQLREEVARLRAERGGPGGLSGLFASGLMGDAGIPSEKITQLVTRNPANALRLEHAWSYRASGRVAVRLTLTSPEGAAPWTADGAALTLEGRRGAALRVLPVWQEAPIPPGEQGDVVVEAEATEKEARGAFTLKLWEAGGVRTVTVGGVTFP
jgi:uncharacterized protein (TIGR02268 family)